jgi:hypothetical protein
MTIPFLGQNFNVITDAATLREYLARGQLQAASVPGDRPGPISADNRVDGELPTGWIIVISVLVGGTVGGLATWRVRRAKRGSLPTGSDDNTDIEQLAASPTSGLGSLADRALSPHCCWPRSDRSAILADPADHLRTPRPHRTLSSTTRRSRCSASWRRTRSPMTSG